MASRCQCCSDIETIQHLFIDSCIANQVWRHFSDIFHVTLRPMEGFQYRFQSWHFSGVLHQRDLTRSTLMDASKMDLRVDEGLLEIHQRLVLSDLWIESDSALAIHCITRGGGPWSIHATLRHIRHLLTFRS
ncbi:hypothetical protein Adt_41030 [Abeliophyllum distichum]|uniref:Uncharacterized protein n=1 Tax=Abeliophyllum distichum TaxID=126358 RepID=A0ABD1PNG9_9LAMI